MDGQAKALAAICSVLLVAGLVDLLRARMVRDLMWIQVQTGRIARSFQRLVRGEKLWKQDRLRISLAVGTSSFLYVTYAADIIVGSVALIVCPWIVLRIARWRRRGRKRKIEGDIPDLSRALADLVASGYSLRGALSEVAGGWSGPIGGGLRQMRLQLELGTSTVKALEGLNERVESQLLDLFVSALLLQRKVGGDLPRLLRDIAKNAEDRDRLVAEAHTASAQARFTATLVLMMPVAGVLLAELAYPGFVTGTFGSFLAVWLVGLSLIFQVIGFLLIRRLSHAPMRWL